MDSKKKKIIIFGLIAAALLAAIITTVVILVDDDDDDDNDDEGGSVVVVPPSATHTDPVTFDEAINDELQPESWSGQWVDATHIQTTDDDGNLVLWDIETDERTVVGVAAADTLPDDWQLISYAPNSASLALGRWGVESIWRYSKLAYYAVYDEETEELQYVLPAGAEQDGGPLKLQYATWLPSDSGENRLAFVYENNINVKTQYDDDSSVTAVTTDGLTDTVYNGKPDWVYEEEILGTDNALYPSSDGRFLAFARFDDTDVEEFHYTVYGDPDDPYANQYPTEIMLKYPKVGTTNPTTSLFVQDLDDLSEAPFAVVPPDEVDAFTDGGSESPIYTAAGFTRPDVLSVTWMNRIQNKCVQAGCSRSSSQWVCSQVYSLEEEAGWLDIFQPPIYKSDGLELIQIQTNTEATGRHYKHVAKVDTSTGDIEFLTSGSLVVTSVSGWDEDNGIVYFMGTGTNDPGSRHLYSVDEDTLVRLCLTCDLDMPTSNAPCTYSTVDMSPDFESYIHNCYGPSVPETVLRDTDTGEVISIMEDNAELIAKLESKAVPTDEFMDVQMSNGWTAKVRMRLPPGLDESVNAAYPMLVDVYGGPESQNVNSMYWSDSWADYLVTNYGVVYVHIDGRGTGFQSNEFLFEMYRVLGTVEIEDQIEVTAALVDMLPYVDPARVGIWGWSYGGYATARILQEDDEDVFACGISVAPPTNWLFYDSMYTERYMALPTEEDNKAGYDAGSVLDKVEQLRGRTFQLNHGVADDNVHYQQSMMLIRALELADIVFWQQSYPDENHGLGNVSTFLYHTFDIFWSQCFDYEMLDKSYVPPQQS